MNSKIYGKLAVTNLKNNKKSYIPYIFASAFSVMMYFIMDNLYRNRSLVEKGSPLAIMLSYADAVLLIFSIIFLFYINSFLIKRRKKELGIYNILGMGKGHLGKMLFLESVITTAASIIGGILAGILLSKLVYLILLKILHMGGKIEYRISLASTGMTTILFGAIFILIFLYNLLQMTLSNLIELLCGGNTGEREPKTKWIMTIIGILCLAGGYSIALITKEPLQALGQFFIAVLLVVVGTYALFMAGSITLLKILRRKKSYYYKTRHFTAVSGMIYRMKQNAVGLANICILSTMVLVMVSMTVSLYGGMNDVITTRFPYEAQITSSGINQKEEGQIEEIIKNMTKKNHTVPTSQIRFHVGRFTTVYNNKTKKLDMMAAGDYTNSNAVDLVMIPLSDYNQTEGKNVKLKENEVLLYHRNHKRTHKKSDTEALKNKKVIQLNSISYKVVDELDRLAIAKADTTSFIDGWYVVVKDSSIITSYLKDIYENSNIYDELKEYYEDNDARVRYITFDLKDGNGDLLKDDGKKEMKSMVEDYLSVLKTLKDEDAINDKMDTIQEEYNAYVTSISEEAAAATATSATDENGNEIPATTTATTATTTSAETTTVTTVAADAESDSEAETTADTEETVTRAAADADHSDETTTTVSGATGEESSDTTETTTTTAPYANESIITKVSTTDEKDKDNEDSINYTPSKKAYEAIFNNAKTNVPFIVEDDEAYYLIVRFDITKRMTDDDLWTEDQMKAVASRKYWDNFTDDKKEMANALSIDQQSDRALKKDDPFKLDFSTSSSSSASN